MKFTDTEKRLAYLHRACQLAAQAKAARDAGFPESADYYQKLVESWKRSIRKLS